jgi:EAL domain-containing protein (putative c-di-GMP-specific phosphodiesterase class I)/ActR/RegA family two-component response regulator
MTDNITEQARAMKDGQPEVEMLASPAALAASLKDRPSVLLIDDEPNVLLALRRGLSAHCLLESASNAVDAFALFNSHGPFSVVVSDLRMPDLSGVEVLKAIHCRSPATAGILLTGSADLAAAMDAINSAHVFKFLAKPCPIPALLAAIQEGHALYLKATAAEAVMRETSHYDALTHLPNQNRFALDFLEDKDTAEHGYLAVVAFEDATRLIDTYGVELVNGLRAQIAQRWIDTTPLSSADGPSIYCIGDHFALLLRTADETVARHTCEAFLAVLRPAFDLKGHALRLKMRAGLYQCRAGDDALQALRCAEAACRAARAGNDAQVAIFGPQSLDQERRRDTLVQTLRSPDLYQQLRLVLQPQWHLVRDKLFGLEALLRWTLPQLGEISPAEFLPLMKELQILDEVDEWALNEACEHRQILRHVLPSSARIAVNVSVGELYRGDFAGRVTAALERSGLPPALLEIELTETEAVANSQHIAQSLDTLTGSGVSLAIDNFGTGDSTLSYVGAPSAHILKIDRTLTQRLTTHETGRDLIERVIDLGHGCGMPVIAEGVENEQQSRMLLLLGCDAIQGYWLAKPLEAHEVEDWLKGRSALINASGYSWRGSTVSGSDTEQTMPADLSAQRGKAP